MKVREVLPLALLYAAKDRRIKGRTRFQKLAFLTGKKLENRGIELFEFVPYDYGPYSKEFQQTIDWLRAEGLITVTKTQTYGGDTRYDYRLTEEGRDSFERNLPKEEEGASPKQKIRRIYNVAENVVDNFNGMPISNLLNHVYSEYPEYAENSVLY